MKTTFNVSIETSSHVINNQNVTCETEGLSKLWLQIIISMKDSSPNMVFVPVLL